MKNIANLKHDGLGLLNFSTGFSLYIKGLTNKNKGKYAFIL